MLNSKKINALENRISALERELNSIILLLSSQETQGKSNKSYEEVINEWLCGKEQA